MTEAFSSVGPGMRRGRLSAALAAAAFALAASACTTTTTTTDLTGIDRAQGSQENIASLTAVINRSPNDPEG